MPVLSCALFDVHKLVVLFTAPDFMKTESQNVVLIQAEFSSSAIRKRVLSLFQCSASQVPGPRIQIMRDQTPRLWLLHANLVIGRHPHKDSRLR